MSYTASNERNSVKVDGRSIHLPVVGRMRMREALRFAGDIGEVAVSKVGKRWFASLQVHDNLEPEAPKPGKDIGIDMGVKTLATVWNEGCVGGDCQPQGFGQGIESGQSHCPQPPYSRQAQPIQAQGRTVRQAQPVAHRHCQPESRPPPQGRRADSQTRRHGEGGNAQRRRHEAQAQAVPRHQRRRHGRIRAAAGVQGWYGTAFEKVDRWYPSSKTCSRCGVVKQLLLLSERTYRCNLCGFECDRDENAARNLQACRGHKEPGPNPERAPPSGEVRRRPNGCGDP